jgi:hypothetical protein
MCCHSKQRKSLIQQGWILAASPSPLAGLPLQMLQSPHEESLRSVAEVNVPQATQPVPHWRWMTSSFEEEMGRMESTLQAWRPFVCRRGSSLMLRTPFVAVPDSDFPPWPLDTLQKQ